MDSEPASLEPGEAEGYETWPCHQDRSHSASWFGAKGGQLIFQRSPWDLGDPGNTNVKTGTLEAKLSHTEDIGAEDF